MSNLIKPWKVDIVSIQGSKLEVVDDIIIRELWDKIGEKWACWKAVGKAGGASHVGR